jgi:type II secretion system protein N
MSTGTGGFFRWILYCCYAVALTAVLLYVRFPGTEVKEYFLRLAEGLFSGTECTIGNISYDFPFGIKFEDVSFSSPNNAKTQLFVLSSLTLTSGLKDFGMTYVLSGQSYSGNFNGTLHTRQKDQQFSLDPLTIQGLDLAEMKPVHDILGREISGRFDYSGTYSAVVNQYLAGKAAGRVKLREGKITLLQPVLNLTEVDLQQVEMEIRYDKNRLQFTKGKVAGKELSADFSGMVQVISPWYLSSVATTGDIALQAQYMRENTATRNEILVLQRQFKKSTIPFRVAGSLQKPALRFGY